jgi:hypothetical protein
MQTANRLIGTTVSGMFDLRLMLQDNTTEEHADIIFKHTERAYDQYRSRTKIGPFTPTIRVVRDAEQLRLEIVAPYSTRPVAKVRLKTQRVGNDTILTIADAKAARVHKPAPKAKHINAGYCLNEVRRQLRTNPDIAPEVKRLSSAARAQLETFLDTCQLRNAGSGDYMFDLDLTDESVTLVAFVNHKRTAAVTVFF